MTACRYDRTLGQRVLPGRHDDGCGGDCDGCQPCADRHCVVCYRGHCDDTSPQTCPECVGLVREHLTAIVDMAERLEDEAVHAHADGRLNTGPLGGDAMVMLGPYSLGGADQLARNTGYDCLGYEAWLGYARDDSLDIPSDPVPPLLVLATWEDDWRIELGHGGGPRATIWRCADYLGTHLTMMAQRHLAFEEFAADLANLRTRMEAVLHDGEREDRTQVMCTNHLCSRRSRLVKVYADTVKNDHYRCPSCDRRYGAGEFRDAHAKHLRSEGAERFVRVNEARATLLSLGRSERTIRKWFEECLVGGYCDTVTREVWCWWPDLWHLHLSTQTRRRNVA